MDPRARYQHYAGIIESLLPPGGPAFEPVAEDETAVQVERGLVLPMTVAGAADGRLNDLLDRLHGPDPRRLRVVDAAGHERPTYAGLLIYAWRRSLTPERWEQSRRAVQRWCPTLHRGIRRAWGPSDGAPLEGGSAVVAGAAWAALAMHAGGWTEVSRRLFPRIAARQQRSGAFQPPAPSENPESYWYAELTLLHAVAAYAVLADDSAAAEAGRRASAYHLNETQPDHATNEPWGLLAFILNPDTRSLADQLLHTVRVQHPGGARGVTAILLADVLDHLRELARRPG